MKKKDRITEELVISPGVESPIVEPEKPPEPQRFELMSDDEIAEYQRYWIEQETGSGGHRPDIAIPAGQGLILIEILKELRGKK